MHVEASTEASMLLARLLLKFGIFGFTRFINMVRLFEGESLLLLGSLGMVLGSFLRALQSDAKALIAYSSVVHTNISFLGLVALRGSGETGSLFLILGHGFSSLVLFYLVGELSHALESRILTNFQGLLNGSLIISSFLRAFLVLNRSMPPSTRFLRELFRLSGPLMR